MWWTESDGGLQRQRQWNNAKTMPVGLAATEHGRYVAIDAGDGAIAVWQFDRDTPQMLRGHQQTVMSLAFSPDGRFLASAGFDGKVVVWDPSTGERIAVLLEAAGVAEWVTFFGDRLAAAGEFGVRTWRIANWAPGSALSSDPHRYVRFSPQGERLVGLSTENQIAVWDLATREPVIVRRSHPPTQGVLFDGSGEGLWVLTRYAFEYQPLDLAPLQMPADELVRAAAAAAGIVQEPHVR
jgi:WD40 repeat protein